MNARNGRVVAQAKSPQKEVQIKAPREGWGEQDPNIWWQNLKEATQQLLHSCPECKNKIKGIGIGYQMHGLVLVDEKQQVLRPSIIWCDGRAVEIGRKAFDDLGHEYCLEHYLNSPANFTASKLKWVKENEPEVYSSIYKVMLPGDYIAMKLTGRIRTSVSGLSEGIFWDYKSDSVATSLLEYYDISPELLPEYDSNFAVSGNVSKAASDELGIPQGIPIGYRAGDQPNNALSLNVLNPGEVAATAGTSGVIYGVTDEPLYDEKSRVNTFVHVNYEENKPRYGVLLCINGTGIQNNWLKNKLFSNHHSYDMMNQLARGIPIGSEGVTVLPFGNGPERVLENKDLGAQFQNLHFNRHGEAHMMRAVQEGIAFSLNYGLKIMKQIGMSIDTIRVGSDNMFQSPVFQEAFTNTTQTTVELYDTNGALGAAIGAGIGTKVFDNLSDAFKNLKKIDTLQPESGKQKAYQQAYKRWENMLLKELGD